MNRALLILAVLEQLHTVHPHGMRAVDLRRGVIRMGHPKETDDTLNSLLVDMEEKKLVTGTRDPLDGTVRIWRRSEEGRVMLQQNGHA